MDEKLKLLFRDIVNEINRPNDETEAAGSEDAERTDHPYGLDTETIEILLDDAISTGG